ncbi:cyclic di-GMP phosphodiesterase response regulator RpfG [Clostridium tepidiprofundi DSM 19306]|uniref:Cyclic di-GMP phosphodiesterase response regulator RpfG n=1 Tax=Clostridium tepidiprofundi DSM 19306 TaxID=1121338 RepID=A0A151B7E0_9CLOT|nr:HD-GYP domain-containing protein [Clostridium tepidiprofundi]KYH35723.1 cyclic di-GMP phosphodiesterase response regulator RpfG [Clostridium tepidiprofundi DSM 19306]
MRLVPIECIKEGAFLGKTIYDNDGRILLRQGVILNNNYIDRIRQLGIFSLYINDEYSSAEIEDIIKPELRQKSIKTLKNYFSHIQNYHKKNEEYFSSIFDIANSIIDELAGRNDLMVNLVDIKSMDNYTYQHSVNVAILSLIIGIQLQLNKDELYKLCTGALLHDIGKVFIPKEIIQKKEKLLPEEYDLIKEHTTKGYNYLKNNIDISPVSRIIILQHHEKVNGTGYPDGKKGNDINKLARIVAIADVYDALTSDRPYRRAMSPNEAIEYILGSGQTYFDFEMVKVFSECIVPYPVGTLVRLSNNDVAVVEKIFPHFALRPIVKVIKSDNVSTIGKVINMMSELDLVIKETEYAMN